MIRGGIGGGNTKTGLIYEAKVNLTTFLNGQKGYVVKDMDIFYNDIPLHELGVPPVDENDKTIL